MIDGVLLILTVVVITTVILPLAELVVIATFKLINKE